MEDPIIELEGLTKCYGSVKAVDNLYLKIDRGEIFGLLGPNGAGKTTTILMMLGLAEPSAGSACVCGVNATMHPIAVKQKVGYMPDSVGFYDDMTAFENLMYIARLNGIAGEEIEARTRETMELVGLGEEMHKKTSAYSRGMKQRLGIATALVHQPELIILDEPTNGLDPQGIADIRNLIIRLRSEMGKTLLISSHLLSEMELIADSMIIIDRGRKVIDGKVNDLFDPSETLVELKTVDHATALAKIKASPLNEYLEDVRQDLIILKLHRDQAPSVIDALRERDINVLSFHAKHSLEDYFLSLTTSKAHAQN